MAIRCTICQKTVMPTHAPFCSERCRHVDLNRWFTGAYAVPAVELDDSDGEVPQTLPQSEE